MEASKQNPAPLDAHLTAKFNEPVWTGQGGDPLIPPLIRIWAIYARIRAGAIPQNGVEGVYEEILRAANNNPPANDTEREDLLTRAMQTEEISWAMDDYIKGLETEEVKEIKKVNTFERLDLYDLRRRTCEFLSNFFSQFNDYRLELIERNYMREEDFIDRQMLRVIDDIKWLMSTIEIRRGN